MKTVFLTGGTGMVGRSILPMLAREYRVIALARNPPRTALPNVKWVRGDLGDIETYLPHLAGVDGVVHLAALIRSGDRTKLTRANMDDTRALIEAAHRVNVKRLIVFSTTALTQDVPTPYAESKHAMERDLESLNVPVYLVRPTLVYGEHFPILARFRKWITGPFPFLFLPNKGNAALYPVYVEDVGRGILELLKHTPASVERVDFFSEEPITLRELIHLLARAMGREMKPVVSIPHAWVKGVVVAAHRLGIPLPLSLLSFCAAGYSYRVRANEKKGPLGKMVFRSAREIIPTLRGGN